MKGLNLLLSVLTFALVLSTAAFAASWTSTQGAGKLYTIHEASITNLDVSTAQLEVEPCSEVDIIWDPSVAVTATVVAQYDADGTVSHTAVGSAASIGVSETTSAIPAGVNAIHVVTANTTSPSTVNIAVVERKFRECNYDYPYSK